jgi:transposase-like protein
MNNKVKLITEQMHCPTCRGRLIKYGIQMWQSRTYSTKVNRYQRYKCKKCNRLLYEYLETVSVSNGGRNSKPEAPISASLTKLIG